VHLTIVNVLSAGVPHLSRRDRTHYNNKCPLSRRYRVLYTSQEQIYSQQEVLWGSISYAVKAPDISPMKTEDLERPTLGPTQAGGSEAENNMCMCVL